MSHQALARKYRPRRFAEVSTQEHVSETLRRAVATDRVAHAYLFCGPRGVGKTTLARVLAMALNCPHRADDGEPCGACESCTRIWGGQTSLDVVEIDAATNRGVDDARELRERAMYAPSDETRFKVYIVDEAHMLTREAWNALLKILEEPPPRVIFVFATTEPQKIQQSAAPILSRCQRFDFRRIGAAEIVGRLGDVLREEGATAPADALRMIARKADGGMRDALSLLDQVLALTGGEVSHDSVRRVLGLVEEERYLELMDLLAEGRHGEIFAFVDGLLDEGYDIVEFYHGLVDALRILLRLRLDPDDLPDIGPELRVEYVDRCRSFDPADLVRMLAMAGELESSGSLRRSAQPGMLVELLLLRFSYLDRTVSLEEILERLGARGEGAPQDPGTSPATRRGGGGASKGSSEKMEPGAPMGSPSPVEPSTEAAPAFASGRSAEEAGPALGHVLEKVLGESGGLPPGLRPFLRAARISAEGPGTIRLSLPQGPGLERLREPLTRRALAAAFGRYVEGDVSIVVSAAEGTGEPTDQAVRISEDTVQRDRLRTLLQREPLLRQAVEELDLELLD